MVGLFYHPALRLDQGGYRVGAEGIDRHDTNQKVRDQQRWCHHRADRRRAHHQCCRPESDDALGNNKKRCQSNSTLVSETNGCVKLDYATHCALTWDGITNNPHLKKQCSK